METTAERETPAPVDPPTVDVSVASDGTGAQVATIAKSSRPRLPSSSSESTPQGCGTDYVSFRLQLPRLWRCRG
ncbi:hypothetical protein KC19_VG225400 [Ceratodon purpureus]|uniref:Uncharacterized protein n=1 Tax=Ceratodon purpureus TaxID=3225 RepID=A0A8T0HT98_CERPU|nr:hypothetical protein KC19_VG225100 [Ceratodon purpureus]KAG0573962.1 hypothetical protein KC19_VG225400 [Ceratodon purpureus]